MNFSYTIKETCHKNSLIYKIFIENKKNSKLETFQLLKKKERNVILRNYFFI